MLKQQLNVVGGCTLQTMLWNDGAASDKLLILCRSEERHTKIFSKISGGKSVILTEGQQSIMSPKSKS